MSVAVAAVCWSGLSAVRVSVSVAVTTAAWSCRHQVVTELGGPLENVDRAGRAVDAHAVAVADAMRPVLRADDRRDPEFARKDGRMRREATGIGHEAGDLREQDDPGR